MRVIVTGCNGKLGRACVAALQDVGHEVFGIDASPRADAGVPVHVGDLRESFTIHRAMDAFGGAPDALVHLANHTNSYVAPEETVLRENIAMNTSAMLGAIRAGTHRVVFSSSVQAFLGGINRGFKGGPPTYPAQLPVDEQCEARPMNSYGLSKLMTEQMLTHLADAERFETACSAASLRLPYILNQQSFEWATDKTGPSDYRWGGPEVFAYVHVDDAAAAVRMAVEADATGHEVFWIAAPDPRPAESAEALVDRYYSDVPGAAEAKARHTLVDTSKAQRLLGWRATRVLSEARTGATSA
ncbi:MAG: NAD(P)-dependent oxidoreductase [Planctomycetota bacterium]